MMNRLLPSLVWCAVACFGTRAATLHVWQDSPSPASPYADWSTAAHTIQDAVDAAQAGDAVLVTNGVYATGGRAVYGRLANRVVVNKPLTLTSVNGSEFTVIQGYQVPRTTNDYGAVRCVYLTNGASLSGFTLTNGATMEESDWQTQQCGGGVWCESTNATVLNCTLTGNSASDSGGGAYSGTLKYCTLTGNRAETGGGAADAVLINCSILRNSAKAGGGAAPSSRHTSCALEKCILTGNTALAGGGAVSSTLNNCVLTGNFARAMGGGAGFCTLNNCTLVGNSAGQGGGVSSGTLNNCIVYYNAATYGANYDVAMSEPILLNYCCTTPLPTDGLANITNEPAFADPSVGNFHLRYGSPCVDAGTDLSAFLTNDLDGRSRPLDGNGDGIAAFDIGAYECGARVRYVWQDSPEPASPYTNWTTAAHIIQDAVDAAVAGDLVLVTNGVYATGGRAVHGLMTNRVVVDKPLTLTSVNGPEFTVIQGNQVPETIRGDQAIRCAYLTSGASLAGFTLTNGATRDEGDSISEQSGGGVWCESFSVMISNCMVWGCSARWYGGGTYSGTLNRCTLNENSATYGGGANAGTLVNCTLSGNAATYGGGVSECTLSHCILSSNSASFSGGGADGGTLNKSILVDNITEGAGGGAWRGTLNSCSLTNNLARGDGGGAKQSTLNNCTLCRNRAEYGGGAILSELNNCWLMGNVAVEGGGGVNSSTVRNCTITGNSAKTSGGAWSCTLFNCIIYFNTAIAWWPNCGQDNRLTACCTTPVPFGPRNITNQPAFVDLAGGDLRLQNNSPCINSGNNSNVTTTADLDGNPRIVNGTVDIGAYEYQGTGSVISYAWLQQYGLPTDGSVDDVDLDHDGPTTQQEWAADTNPTNAASLLRVTIQSNGPPVAVSFASSKDRLYTLLSCTNLTGTPTGLTWTPAPGQTDVPGSGDVLTVTDTNPPPTVFYRVSVRFP